MKIRCLLPLAAVMFAASLAAAQEGVRRAWVAGTGDDASVDCSRTAPCKTFGRALVVVDPGGEINVVDPGGFGYLADPITITKPVTIDGGGSFAGILAEDDPNDGGTIDDGGALGVLVTMQDSNPVERATILRNLTITGSRLEAGSAAPLGKVGIRFVGGGILHVENCTIVGFQQEGIDCRTIEKDSRLFVKDTVIEKCSANKLISGAAVYLRPNNSNLIASFDNVRIEGNRQTGLRTLRRVVASMSNSVIAGNIGNGVLNQATAVPESVISLEHCVVAGNKSFGIYATGAVATVYLNNVSVFRNGLPEIPSGGGLQALAGSQIICSDVSIFHNNLAAVGPAAAFVTFGNNKIRGTINGADAFPAGTIAAAPQ